MLRTNALLPILQFCGCALLIFSVACGSTQVFEDESTPITDNDPIPYIPTPNEGTANVDIANPHGLVVTTEGDSRAHAVVLSVLEAIRDSDAGQLRQLLSDRVCRSTPRVSAPWRAQSQVISDALSATAGRRRGRFGRSSSMPAGIPISQLVYLDRFITKPMSKVDNSLPGLRDSDVLVSFELTSTGRQAFRRRVVGWFSRGGMVVRFEGSRAVVMCL